MTNGRSPIIFNSPSLVLVNNTTLPFRSFGAFNELYVNYNLKLKNNLFFEGGLRYTTMFHGYTVNEWLVGVQGSSKEYVSIYGQFVFNMGAGYKMNINQKRNIFDVQAGLIVGFTDQQKGVGGQIFGVFPYTDATNNSGTLAIVSNYRIQNAGFWGLYYGISKEVKVTKNLYASAMYNFQLGLSTISEHTFQYEVSGLGIENSVKGVITARSRILGLGLKWHFGV